MASGPALRGFPAVPGSALRLRRLTDGMPSQTRLDPDTAGKPEGQRGYSEAPWVNYYCRRGGNELGELRMILMFCEGPR